MQGLSLNSFTQNFLGHAPDWYKKTIVAFLVLNPFLLLIAGPYIAVWVLVLEFIFTLAMALKDSSEACAKASNTAEAVILNILSSLL